MKTITILIGNSDNKLSQAEWSYFCYDIHSFVRWYANQIHFVGGTSYDSPFQSSCYVFEIEEDNTSNLIADLKKIKYGYIQDSIALITINTTDLELI